MTAMYVDQKNDRRIGLPSVYCFSYSTGLKRRKVRMTLSHRDQKYQRSGNNASEIKLSQPSRPKVDPGLSWRRKQCSLHYCGQPPEIVEKIELDFQQWIIGVVFAPIPIIIVAL